MGSEAKHIIRKFKAIVDQSGLDDLGASSITFSVKELTKGEIYEEHQKWVDVWDGSRGKRGMKEVPSGYVIDDNDCWNRIGTSSFNKMFEEVV